MLSRVNKIQSKYKILLLLVVTTPIILYLAANPSLLTSYHDVGGSGYAPTIVVEKETYIDGNYRYSAFTSTTAQAGDNIKIRTNAYLGGTGGAVLLSGVRELSVYKGTSFLYKLSITNSRIYTVIESSTSDPDGTEYIIIAACYYTAGQYLDYSWDAGTVRTEVQITIRLFQTSLPPDDYEPTIPITNPDDLSRIPPQSDSSLVSLDIVISIVGLLVFSYLIRRKNKNEVSP